MNARSPAPGPTPLKVCDPFHDAHLLRDVEIINAHTAATLGPLPPGGVPAVPKRKPLPWLQEPPLPTGHDDKDDAMPKMPKQIAAVASLALAACATPGTATPQATQPQESASMPAARYTYPDPPVVTSGELSPTGDPSVAAKMNFKPLKWPLRFKRHTFEPRCYDTIECHVSYDGFEFGGDKPTKPSASFGEDYLADWNGSYGPVPNFPGPAKVMWRSKDGASHEAMIEFETIFSDELIHHYLPKEEVADLPDGEMVVPPSILLEVNDRTIRVYMNAFLPTKHLQIPGNPRSKFRSDVILVKTFVY